VSTAKLWWLWRNCRDAGDRRGAWCPDRGICDHRGRAILRLLLTWPAWPSSGCPRRAGRCICWPGPAPVRRLARGAAWCRGGCTAATGGSWPTRPAAARKCSLTCRPAGSSARTTAAPAAAHGSCAVRGAQRLGGAGRPRATFRDEHGDARARHDSVREHLRRCRQVVACGAGCSGAWRSDISAHA
jgi:hypothetical protein